MPKKSPIRPEDICEIRQPLQCRLSRSGDRLAVVVGEADKDGLKNISRLWMVELDGAGLPPVGGSASARASTRSITRAITRSRRAATTERPQTSTLAGGLRVQIGQADRVRLFTHGKHSDHTPRWSPGGSTLAFLSNRSGKTELWLIAADGGEARQLTHMKGNISDFDWHPDGRRLVVAFVPQDEEAKEREEKKKKGEPGAEAPRVRQVRRLFYKLDGAGFLPAGRRHLWLVDAETGKARQLTDDERYDEDEPRFSPDGRWVYFVSNRSEDPDLRFLRIDTWRMPARGGSIEKVRNFDGPSDSISLSPDGNWIAYLGTPDPNASWNRYHTKLYLAPSSGGRPVELSARLDRACNNSTISDTYGLGGTKAPIWSPDSRWVYFLVTNEGNSEIWRVEISEKSPEPVWNEAGGVIDYEIDFAEGWIHAAFSDLGNPGEIVSLPLRPPARRGARGSREAALTARSAGESGAAGAVGAVGAAAAGVKHPVRRSEFNTGWLENRVVAVPEELWYEGTGRTRLQGWILNPPALRRGSRSPGILYIHGGPATQYGRVFFHEFQVLAAAGYVVFYTNPRGGTGYSERHLNAILGRWGTHDYDDLMRFTDTVLRRARHLDRGRLAVAGGSYGGFMTNWIIGHTQRFACAITSRSISNFMSFVGSSDFGFAWPQEFQTTGPWDSPQKYLKMSPLTYLKQMKTPTLIEHQEEDHRCPIEQAEQLWAALKAKGVPVDFVRYPGEPHGMSRGGRPDRRIDRLERILAWLDRWTSPRRRPAGARKKAARRKVARQPR